MTPQAAAAALGVALPPGPEEQAQALEVAICCRALELYPPAGDPALAWAAEIYGQMSAQDRRGFAAQRSRWADDIDGTKRDAPRPRAETVCAHLDRLVAGELIGENRHIAAVELALSLMTGQRQVPAASAARTRYQAAEAVLAHFCAAPSGQAWSAYWADLRGRGAPQTGAPDSARRAIDLAIRLMCDPRPLAVLVADAVADLLWRGRGEADQQGGPEHALGVMRQVHARARRMLRVVAPRTP